MTPSKIPQLEIKQMKLKCTCGKRAVGFKMGKPICSSCWETPIQKLKRRLK